MHLHIPLMHLHLDKMHLRETLPRGATLFPQPRRRWSKPMVRRNSQAEQVSRNHLAVAAAKAHAAQLPLEVQHLAAELEARNAHIPILNAKQEQAKAALAQATKEVTAELKAAGALRARIVKAAEFTFGARAPQVRAFRPATEGQG